MKSEITPKRIGIFGGTFDPIHLGHLVLAEHAAEETELDVVYFMPAHLQPFKLQYYIADDRFRHEMLQIATKNNKKFKITTVELENKEISYTINSLDVLKTGFDEDAELFFIMGTDSFLNLEKWYRSEDLLRRYSFIVGERPRYKNKEVKSHIEYLQKKYGTYTMKIDNIMIDISSTDIKKRIGKQKSIKYLVPEDVEKYIYEKKLYRDIE